MLNSARVPAALAIAAALLVVLASAAGAQSAGLVVASEHATDADFNGATTLENATVEGSGSDAYVELANTTISETTSYTSAGTYTYQPPPWAETLEYTLAGEPGEDGTGSPDGAGGAGGDAGQATGEVPVEAGSYDVNVGTYGDSGAGGCNEGFSDSLCSGDGGQASFVNNVAIAHGGGGGGGAGEEISGDIYGGGGGGGGVSGGAGGAGGADNTSSQTDFDGVDGGTAEDTFVQSGGGDGGDGGGDAGLDGANGADGGADIISGSGTTGTSPGGPSAELTAVGETPVDHGVYVSAPHDVDDPAQARVDLTLNNAEATVIVGDGAKKVAEKSGITSSGEHTVAVPDGVEGSILIRVEFSALSGDTTARIHDDAVLFEPRDPSIDDSSADPAGGTEIQDDSVSFQIDISDADFATAQGDELTAELVVDGESRGSDILLSNGTATVTETIETSGSHSYHWEVEDQWGPTSSSSTYSIFTPTELEIRNESAPDQIINNVEVEVRFFGNSTGTTIDRTTNDGTVDLSGLPANTDFVVYARADGYFNRRVYIESLYEQQRIYMLSEAPTNGTWSVYNVFDLSDRSGQFEPATSTLMIQRALNVSGELQWQTVSGDQFGATNAHETNLRYNQRYRLIVRSEDGDQRDVGAYMATDEANPKTVLIRQIVIRPGEGREFVGNAWVEDANETDAHETLYFTYSDPSNETSSLDLEIYERGNESNVLDTASVTDLGSQYAYTRQLTGDARNTTWMVNWTGTRDGESIGAVVPVGGPTGLELPIDPLWLGRFGLIAIPIVAALSSERIATYGAMGTVVFAGLVMLLGWVQIHPALWWLAAIIAGGAHMYTISTRGGAISG